MKIRQTSILAIFVLLAQYLIAQIEVKPTFESCSIYAFANGVEETCNLYYREVST